MLPLRMRVPCSRYRQIIQLGEQRRKRLEEASKGYQLLREANELADWIKSKVSHPPPPPHQNYFKANFSCFYTISESHFPGLL